MEKETPSAQPAAPEQKIDAKNDPNLKGLENLDKIEALKKGAFREFIDKVMAIRRNPEEQKKITEKLEKIDNDTQLTDNQKKEALRSQSSTELFAVIGKNIEFGAEGMSVTFDFGKLAFAEKTAIGAGHILPPNIGKIKFGEGKNATEAKRQPGTRGGEYRTEKDKYMSSYTNTKVFIKYTDIMPFDAKQMEEATKKEQESVVKKVATVDTAHDAHADLRAGMPQAGSAPHAPAPEPTATQKPAESKDIQVSHAPVFIGDSQMEGMGPTLRRKGIKAIDLRSMKMEDIARGLKDPGYLNTFYERTGNGQAFAESRKRTLLAGVEALKTADTVMLQCGGNNIANGHSLETMQRHFRTLIGTIREINPNAKIRVGLMLIRDTNRPENDVATRYNEWLKGNAQKEGVTLVDSRGIMMAYREKFPNRNWGKGAHLHGDEYKNLANGVIDAIGYQSPSEKHAVV